MSHFQLASEIYSVTMWVSQNLRDEDESGITDMKGCYWVLSIQHWHQIFTHLFFLSQLNKAYSDRLESYRCPSLHEEIPVRQTEAERHDHVNQSKSVCVLAVWKRGGVCQFKERGRVSLGDSTKLCEADTPPLKWKGGLRDLRQTMEVRLWNRQEKKE